MALNDRRAEARGGFASRASRVDPEQDTCAFGMRTGRAGASRGFADGSVAPSRRSGEQAVRASSGALEGQALQRAKRLAGVTGVAVAVALASVGYATWTSASSRAAVDEATTGALPTLVAVTDIRAGDRLSTESVEVREVPRAYRSESVLRSDALATGGAPGRALVDIPAGTPIAASFVTGAENDGRLSAELAAGKEAVTVAVDSETGLAGRVRPYDTVRVVSAEGASAGASLLETVCERVRVVAVGDEASAGETVYTSVTIEVSSDEADAVREAQYAGRVSLVLLAADDSLVEPSVSPPLSSGQEGVALESGEEVERG